MIFGDDPMLLREYEDPLGLNAYTYSPDIQAIRQSGNLYVYCMNNPIAFVDPTGLKGNELRRLSENQQAQITGIRREAWDSQGKYVAGGVVVVGVAVVATPAAAPVVAKAATGVAVKAAPVVATVGGAGTIAAQQVANSGVLRQAMVQAGKIAPTFQNAAHHIVAGTAKAAEPARLILQKFGVGINDAVNGIFLPTVRGVSNAAYHPSIHTAKYYETVNTMLSKAQTKAQATQILKTIADMLSKGTFPN
jgi:hypothetical protein